MTPTPPEDVRVSVKKILASIVNRTRYVDGATNKLTPVEAVEMMWPEVEDLLDAAKSEGIEIGRKQKGNSGRLMYQEGYQKAMADTVSGKIKDITLYKRSFEAGKAVGYKQGVKAMQEMLALKKLSFYIGSHPAIGLAQTYDVVDVKDITSVADKLLTHNNND